MQRLCQWREPFVQLIAGGTIGRGFFHSGQIAPVGVNGGGYRNPKVDALIDEAKQRFDPARQDELLAQPQALIVDDAALVWVVHDTNPHALSPKVKKFVQAQHWFQDLTTIGLQREPCDNSLIPGPPAATCARNKKRQIDTMSFLAAL